MHEVTAGGNTYGFGDLAEDAMKEAVPEFEALTFKDESEFRYIGKRAVGIYDLHDITTGKAVYGADISLPGMKFAAVARPKVHAARPVRYDASASVRGPWRREGSRHRDLGLPGQVHAQGRDRGHREQHRLGHSRP